jgi:hypothetical protein
MTILKITHNRIIMLGIILCLAFGEVGCIRMVDQKDRTNSDETEIAAGTSELECSFSCAMKSDTVLARNAVGPSWIAWETPCFPNADLVYVDLDTWDIWVMDEMGGNKRCLTCYNNCSHWPLRCQRGGAQFSRLTWKDDGTALFFGLWIHAGPLRPFSRTELHKLDFCGACGSD